MNPHVNRCILESEPTSVSYLDMTHLLAQDDLGELYLGSLVCPTKVLNDTTRGSRYDAFDYPDCKDDKSLPDMGCEPIATQREATFFFMAISESVNPLEYLVQITSSNITW